jgi:nicotianamine synthase
MAGVGRERDEVVARVVGLHGWLEGRAGDLRPSPEVDAVFGALVALVLTTPPGVAGEALADPAVRRCRDRLVALAARGEHELELAWARRIAAGGDLGGFPYLDHYRRLVDAEVAALVRHGCGPGARVLFVGAGPLPLSPLLLAGRGLAVDALDRDAGAVVAARAVASTVVPAPVVAEGDLFDRPGLDRYDAVVLAALVGLGAGEKRRCLDHLAAALRPGALVLARSARGLRTLLYPEVELPPGGGLAPLDVVHPAPPVINSIVVARATGGGPPGGAPTGGAPTGGTPTGGTPPGGGGPTGGIPSGGAPTGGGPVSG